MNMWSHGIVIVSVLLFHFTGTIRVEAAEPKEISGLNGKWLIVSAVISGAVAGEDEIMDRTMVFDNGNVTVSDSKGKIQGKAFTDGTATPAICDITYTTKEGKNALLKGICKIDDDKLTLCYEVEGKIRPTEFASKMSSGIFLETYKRAK